MPQLLHRNPEVTPMVEVSSSAINDFAVLTNDVGAKCPVKTAKGLVCLLKGVVDEAVASQRRRKSCGVVQ